MIGGQTWDSFLGSWPEVDAVEAAAADIGNGLVAVGFGVPCVAAVLLLAQSLPHVTDARRKAHFGYLTKPEHRGIYNELSSTNKLTAMRKH